MAQQVLIRENKKLEVNNEAQQVWDQRAAFVDLKRKFPMLGAREDEEFLVDRPKKPKLNDSAYAFSTLAIPTFTDINNYSVLRKYLRLRIVLVWTMCLHLAPQTRT